MKTAYLILLSALCFNTAWADFANTGVYAHPLYWVSSEPYLLDIKGNWTSDCHPGEQKPVISEYTGDSVLIEFEIITEHVTCNDILTPYRVLVDMSDVVDDVPGEFFSIDVSIRFGGDEHMERVFRGCPLCSPPPPPRDVKPESGIYYSNGLEKQGLLIARQNQRMGAYPLIYDESGSSEWVLGPGGIVEDVFFAELYESTGGQCLGCPQPDDPPQMGAVGKISMLMDSEGIIQVKINDGLFRTYEPSQFGYIEFTVMGLEDNGAYTIPDLSGRWAFSDNNSWFTTTTPPPTEILPLVFDINLKTLNPDDPVPPAITPPPPQYAGYSVLNIDGEPVAELLCGYRDEMVCDLKSPTIGEFESWFEVRMLSIERMTMTNMAPNDPHDGIVNGTGIAVRID